MPNDNYTKIQKISQEDRERLIRAFEQPERAYFRMTVTLGVKRQRENFQVHERPRGGCNRIKFDDEMSLSPEGIINEHCSLKDKINRKL